LLTFDDTPTALEDGSSSFQPACVGSLVCFVRSSSFFSGWVSEASMQVYQMDQIPQDFFEVFEYIVIVLWSLQPLEVCLCVQNSVWFIPSGDFLSAYLHLSF
jgi:hypothetical protein